MPEQQGTFLIDCHDITDAGLSVTANLEIFQVSGKLDLREKLEDVVNILCQSLYLTYSVNENKDIIIIKK